MPACRAGLPTLRLQAEARRSRRQARSGISLPRPSFELHARIAALPHCRPMCPFIRREEAGPGRAARHSAPAEWGHFVNNFPSLGVKSILSSGETPTSLRAGTLAD